MRFDVRRTLGVTLMIAVLSGGLSLPQTGHAAAGKIALGVNLGAVLPSTSSSALGWGLDAFYGLSALSVGAFYSSYGVGLDVNNDSTTATVSSSTKLYGGFARYDFSGSLQNFYGTFRLGFSKTAATVTATQTTTSARVSSEDSSSAMIFGPGFGYDRMVSPSFSLGGELRYVLGLSSSAAKSLSLLFSAKFWF